jgi:N-methylhydantoinase A/oxoprolinase/acetone carboxylase beta subunit
VVLWFQETLQTLESQLEVLRSKCVQYLKSEGFEEAGIKTEDYLHLRYHGTDCALVNKIDGLLVENALCGGHGIKKVIENSYV